MGNHSACLPLACKLVTLLGISQCHPFTDTFCHCSQPAPSSNPLMKMFAGCPENAFQKVPPGYAPFTMGQRVGAVIRNGETGLHYPCCRCCLLGLHQVYY